MSWAVLNVGQQALWSTRELEDSLSHAEIFHKIQAPNIVDLSDSASLENGKYSTAVVLHVQPIALLLAVAINGEILLAKGICDHERHKFFGKLIRPIVVRRPRDYRGETIRADIGPYQEIGRGLRGGVRTARLQRKTFVREDALRNVAVHFVGGNMHKPGHGNLTRDFEQNESARDVGLDDWSWLVDASVDVGFRGEVNDSITTTHGLFHRNCVTNVALYKFIARIVRYCFQVREISRISQLVVVDDGYIFSGLEDIANKVGANKAGASRDKNPHLVFCHWSLSLT